jgi:hypothetical protein
VAEAGVAEVIGKRLGTELGPNVARMAMKSFCQKALGRTPEQVTRADVPKLMETMRPMLHVMLGNAQADGIIDEIVRDLK